MPDLDPARESVAAPSVTAGWSRHRTRDSPVAGDLTVGADDDGAESFVAATEFESSYLVVVRVAPASTVPDHRVESVLREGDGLELRMNGSATGGTDDVTVGTLPVRVSRGAGDPPSSVTVTTEEGVSFDTDDGVSRPAGRLRAPVRGADPAV